MTYRPNYYLLAVFHSS